ncbi:unnamed protein product, partial [marine sediment metagenome]
QEPMTSLDPVFSIGEQLVDVIRAHEVMTRANAEKMAIDVLRQVNMPNPEMLMKQYPHELSSGMRQRVMIGAAVIARAIRIGGIAINMSVTLIIISPILPPK